MLMTHVLNGEQNERAECIFLSREAKQISVTKIKHKTNLFSILHSHWHHNSFNFCSSNLMFIVQVLNGEQIEWAECIFVRIWRQIFAQPKHHKTFFLHRFFFPKHVLFDG